MVSGFRTKYQRTKCQKACNWIEACQWIVARPRHLPCFTPQNGVKHDKIIFHEFFCVCNVFSFSPVSLSPSLSLFLPYISLPLSPCLSLFLPLSISPRVWRFLLPADHGIGGLICPCLVAWSPWFIFLLYTYDYLYFILFSFQISVVI